MEQAYAGEERRSQCSLLRDIFGNPFRPVSVDPRWLSSSVFGLVRTVYEDRRFGFEYWSREPKQDLARTAYHDRFDHLPVLADVLEEAGCSNPDILGHLRAPGPHVRGCWVIDLLLGRG
jgi:hypothetical protein